MALIDAHVHIYPEKIAERAVASVADFYQIKRDYTCSGTVPTLMDIKANSDLTHFIVYSVAVKPSTVTGINDFIAGEMKTHPECIGFMAMHQDFENMEAEIDRAIGLGLKGIKIHPDTQQVGADDPRLMEMYEIAQAKRLPVVIHAGDYRFDYSHPRRIANVLHAFPDLVIDAAHFGGWSLFDIGADLLKSERCFVDTSSSVQFVGERHVKELINLYGVDRVLFGSDFPMWDPVAELECLRRFGLSEKDFEAITWHNAEAFLGFRV